MGHSGEFWQNVVHWRREWQTTSVFLPWESHEEYERQKDRILKDELPMLVGEQSATGYQWRNNSRKNEEMEPKQKQYPVVDVTGDGSKVRCCKEQYCLGTWNVRSMNQGKLEVVRHETARVNIDILGISKLKWTGMGEFNSDYPTENVQNLISQLFFNQLHLLWYRKHKTIWKKWYNELNLIHKIWCFLEKLSMSFHVSLLLTVEMMRHKWPQKAIKLSSMKTKAETQMRR